MRMWMRLVNVYFIRDGRKIKMFSNREMCLSYNSA